MVGWMPCCCECWIWEDHFNRTASTDVGSDWNEVSGNWEIANSGYGDANPASEAPPLNQLHEVYGTAIGAGGTSCATIIGTTPQPADSAGQQYLYVRVQEPATGDVYWLYPCCTNTSTVGAVAAKFTYNGSLEWLVEVGTASQTASGTPFSDGMANSYVYFKLGVCVDHDTQQVKAWVSGFLDPAWDDALDPGVGRYYGLGHSNSSTGAVFDDVYVTELWNGLESCASCLCSCLGNAATRHLYAEVHLAIDRAACIDGVGWPMTYLDGPGDPTPSRWHGTAHFPRWDAGTQDVLWHLTCDSGSGTDPDAPGDNFVLSTSDVDGGCTHMKQISMGDATPRLTTADPDLSVCDPLELWFGPYLMTVGDLICNACEQPATGTATGEFWIVVTEV